MSRSHMMTVSERWFRLLLRFYPADFRDEMGDSLVEAYRDRAQDVLRRGGTLRLAAVCVRALADSLRHGVGERLRPAISWRRSRGLGPGVEHASRPLTRAPALVLSPT